ncbi:hypothetical protein [Granulicella tundricola]|uniref:Uncharacterized protein n=1 Tax=Granulicella tundricola (strain ATCC BAA-1859 / DSM 23138 / MP5ACTX9) TaxID=1198114 RepID=E8X0R2_GRATM|nr:hypothetical protein [Granulicella tundricola]ADW69013.1 hypothetical protein AciX9_1967 [Granulicella tundricola MP5ACTX9]
MAKVAKNPALDPTLPKVELKLKGKTYHLCFTFAALATAEAALKKIGHEINIFHALDFANLGAESLAAILYAALITETPDFNLLEVPTLITMRDIPAIKQALFDAFALSMVEPDKDAKADPLENPLDLELD